MKRHIPSTLIILATLSAGHALAFRSEVASFAPDSFHALLQSGRKVSYRRLETVAADPQTYQYAASPGAVIAEKRDLLNNAVIGLQFATRRMPNVKETALVVEAFATLDMFADTLGTAGMDFRAYEKERLWLNDQLLVLQYQRMIEGVPVRDSYIEFTYAQSDADSFRLYEITARVFANTPVVNATKTPSSWDVVKNAYQELAAYQLASSRVVVVSRTPGEIDQLVLAREYRVVTDDPHAGIVLTIAHGESDILEAYSEKVHVDETAFHGVIHERN